MMLTSVLFLTASVVLTVSGDGDSGNPSTPASNETSAADSDAAKKGSNARQNSTGEQFQCYVCSNSKNLPKIGLYHSDCLKSPDKLPAEFIWNCTEYGIKMEDIYKNYSYSPSKTLEMGDNKFSCDPSSYSVCRSYYYETNKDYTDPKTGKKQPAMQDSNERVFRFCGCLKKDGVTSDGTNNEEMRKKEFGSSDKKCSDFTKGITRKRYCVCKPTPGGKPCNSTPSLRCTWLTNMIASLLVLLLVTVTRCQLALGNSR